MLPAAAIVVIDHQRSAPGPTTSTPTATPTETATTSPTSGPTTVPAPPVPTTIGPDGGITYDVSALQGAAFESPLGNLHCAILGVKANPYGKGSMVGCAVDSPHYTPPPHPSQDVCPTDYGYGMQLQRKATFMCGDLVLGMASLSDTSMDPLTQWFDPQHNAGGNGDAAVLDFGNSIRFDAFLCTSTKLGVRCTNTDTGAGFLLSPDRYRLFG